MTQVCSSLPPFHDARLNVVLDLPFPPADIEIRNCLTRAFDMNKLTERYLKFFSSLFKATKDELRRHDSTFPHSRGLADWWSTQMNGHLRKDLYSQVAVDTEKEITFEVRARDESWNKSHDCVGART
jgi:hypothetical protein